MNSKSLLIVQIVNPEDISVRGLRLVQGAKRVYLEMYTAILMASQEEIEKTYERKAFLYFLVIQRFLWVPRAAEKLRKKSFELDLSKDALFVRFRVGGRKVAPTQKSHFHIFCQFWRTTCFTTKL